MTFDRQRVRVDDACLEVHEAHVDLLGTDGVAGSPVKSGCGELVGHVAVADPFLADRHRIAPDMRARASTARTSRAEHLATHVIPLEDGPDDYAMFMEKTDGCVRAVFHP